MIYWVLKQISADGKEEMFQQLHLKHGINMVELKVLICLKELKIDCRCNVEATYVYV